MTSRSLLLPTVYASIWAASDILGDGMIRVFSFMGQFTIAAAGVSALCAFLPRLSLRGRAALTLLPIAAVWLMAAVVQNGLTPGSCLLALCVNSVWTVELVRQKWVMR